MAKLNLLPSHAHVFATFKFSPSLRLRPSPRPILLLRKRASAPRRAIAASAFVREGGNGSIAAGTSDGKGVAVSAKAEEYPTGEMHFEEFDWKKKVDVKLRMLIALPWERVKKGSVLSMKIRGEISDQFKSSFSSALSLPQICENITKAAYDPRIAGIYLHIEPLSCGWGKIEEIRRSIHHFKKSGKFILGFIPICSEKEYYLGCACGELYAPPSAYVSLFGFSVQASFVRGVFEKIGIEPEVQRIGKYKSAGDQIARKNMSEENREMLTSLLDNVYQNWLDTVSATIGKERKEIEDFINSGVYQVERLKEQGWITDMLYDDQIISMLKERTGVEKDKDLPMVDYKRYSRVRKWTVGLYEGGEKIAIIRASGGINLSAGRFSVPSSNIIAEDFIKNIRKIRDSKDYRAAIIRIDSPGGDALASDLMWREIKVLAASMPVIASMSDVAASGGYYMAMGAETIVSEKLTFTGSIGVVTGRLSLKDLYERIGYTKEVLSRGRYAELVSAEQRPLSPDETELFARSAQTAYRQFRDKAALSRSMTVDQMEEVAQGRVWTGADAASRGLVDAIGGLSRAVAIAKQKANIPQDRPIILKEISSPMSLSRLLSDAGSAVLGLDIGFQGLVHGLGTTEGVQARLDDTLFDTTVGSYQNAITSLGRSILKLF